MYTWKNAVVKAAFNKKIFFTNKLDLNLGGNQQNATF